MNSSDTVHAEREYYYIEKSREIFRPSRVAANLGQKNPQIKDAQKRS